MKTFALLALRKKIDKLDGQITRLLNQRAALALVIGKIKQQSRAETYAPDREKAVLDRIARSNRGPLSSSSLAAIYREIMSASLALEKNISVAYLGPPVSFSHQAALKRFGASIAYRPCDTIDEVFETVQKNSADYGVVPVENLIEGAVANTLDRLTDTALKICAEIYLPIAHCLMAAGPRAAIRRILSNPYVFGQCRQWLRKAMPAVELVPVPSTTRAAEMAAKDRRSAAIAGRLAAAVYRLKILADDIQDISDNTTRFLVLGRSFGNKTGADKTSLLFAVKHQAGSLYRALGAFKKYNLNMTRIESRPSRVKAWEYRFFVDLEGHVDDLKVQKALRNLDKHCQQLTILGSYPKAVE